MKIKLVRVESTNNSLRTDEVVGEIFLEPTVGYPLVLFGQPLGKGDVRKVTTSPITELTENGFKTLNSTYEYEVLSE